MDVSLNALKLDFGSGVLGFDAQKAGIEAMEADRTEQKEDLSLPVFLPQRIEDAQLFRFSCRFDESLLPRMVAKELADSGNSARLGFLVQGAYKRKAQKVKPVDSSISDGSTPGGSINWKKEAIAKECLDWSTVDPSFRGWLHPKFSAIKHGSRLTSERMNRLIIGKDLSLQEREVFLRMLYNREAALSWEMPEIGKVKRTIAPPQKIRTIPHDAWQAPSFPVPRALNGVVIDMLKERLTSGALEYCHGSYRNPWFLVKKKSGKYRMVNAAMNVNQVTIRDANLPPAVDDFAEEFAGMEITSLIDFYSGYD